MKALFVFLALMLGVSVFAGNSSDQYAAVRGQPTFKDDIYLCKDDVVKKFIDVGWEISSWNDENLLLYSKNINHSNSTYQVTAIISPTMLNENMSKQGVGYLYTRISINPRNNMIRFDDMAAYDCTFHQMNYYNLPHQWEKPKKGDIFDKLVQQTKQ